MSPAELVERLGRPMTLHRLDLHPIGQRTAHVQLRTATEAQAIAGNPGERRINNRLMRFARNILRADEADCVIFVYRGEPYRTVTFRDLWMSIG